MTRELFHDIAQLLIGLTLIGGGFWFLHQVFFSSHAIAPELKDPLVQVTGGVLALLGGIAGFYFGSSLSSARKDSVIANKGTHS